MALDCGGKFKLENCLFGFQNGEICYKYDELSLRNILINKFSPTKHHLFSSPLIRCPLQIELTISSLNPVNEEIPERSAVADWKVCTPSGFAPIWATTHRNRRIGPARAKSERKDGRKKKIDIFTLQISRHRKKRDGGRKPFRQLDQPTIFMVKKFYSNPVVFSHLLAYSTQGDVTARGNIKRKLKALKQLSYFFRFYSTYFIFSLIYFEFIEIPRKVFTEIFLIFILNLLEYIQNKIIRSLHAWVDFKPNPEYTVLKLKMFTISEVGSFIGMFATFYKGTLSQKQAAFIPIVPASS